MFDQVMARENNSHRITEGSLEASTIGPSSTTHMEAHVTVFENAVVWPYGLP